jgi:hypothetical protein
VSALKYDLIVKQGADYVKTFPVLGLAEDDTLDGWTFAGQVRASYAPSAPLLHTLDLSVSGQNLVVRIPHAASSAWTWRLARYDVEYTAPDGSRDDFLEGAVVVRPAITRIP